jgi:DNA-binding NtrC family response regulator
MLRLVVRCGEEQRTIPLTAHRSTLGSSRKNDVVISCRGVSRTHATLTREGASLVIEDAGSRNGLRHSGKRVSRVELLPGDDVQIGAALLRLEEVSTSENEIALRLGDDSSVRFAPSDGDTESVALVAPGERSAWAWVKDVEEATDHQGRRRNEFLRRASATIEAEAIIRCRIARSGDVVIEEVLGQVPPGAESGLAEIVKASASARGGKAVVLGRWAAVPIDSRSAVVAMSRHPSFSRAAWCREFLEFVTVKLFVKTRATELVSLQKEGSLVFPERYVSGESSVMRAFHDQLRRTVHSDAPVLLRGENGTGKELIAQILHASGARAKGPWRVVNCAAVPANLLEAELFGILRNVATGVAPRRGLFAEANHGTMFLDEIGDLPLELQPKLLRVLQEREIQSLGASVPTKLDFRVIAATNRDLEGMMAAGTFRPDLYHRLRHLEVTVPPLRSRKEDIAQLLLEFVPRIAREHRRRIRGVTVKTLSLLQSYDWPGNVRELENAVARAISHCPEGHALESRHFDILAGGPPSGPVSSLRTTVDSAEKEAIVDALRRGAGNKSEAARLLGITRPGLYLKLARYGLK